MGMHNVCMYERFSITDVGKFERRLKNWCNEVSNMHGKSMLVFDRASLRVDGESTVEKFGNEEFYKMILPNMSLTYTCIPGTTMCVMHKIWENKTQSVMYSMPQKWEGTELWLGV